MNYIETEKALLGAILHNPDSMIDIVEIVSPQSFRGEQNAQVYASMLALFNSHRPVDYVTVADHTSGSVDGSSSYCADLFSLEGIEYGRNAVHYAEMVAEADKWYRLALAGADISDMAMTQEAEVGDALDRAEGLIFDIATEAKKETGAYIGDLLQPTLDEIEAARAADGGVIGISSGFRDVDQLTSGWHKADLSIVAARPAMGKSAFAMQVALNAARSGINAAFFSLEMGGTQLVQRVLTGMAGVDGQRARQGYTSDDDWSKLTLAAGKLHNLPLYIDDDFSMTPTELRAKCRRLKMKRGLGLVVVDYLQLMHVAALRKGANREQEIAQISRSLKGLAKELDVPVIALSQLNRGVETRGANARPQLSDLRESGAIEQDADNVFFIHRPAYYGITMDPETGRSMENIAEVIVAKQRSGPTGKAELFFANASFANLQKERYV